MTRIEGVPRSKAGPLVRSCIPCPAQGQADRRRRPRPEHRADRVYAHVPSCCIGYGMLEKSVATRPRVEERLRVLAVLKAAVMQGCEFCQDIGSHEARGRASATDSCSTARYPTAFDD